MIRAVFVFAVLVCTSVVQAAASTGDRVALVIGNAKYRHTAELSNPGNDALAIAAELRTLGFDVLHVTDTAQADLGKALLDFEAKLDGADSALFYYAGHGMQLGGENFLLSVDAKVENQHLLDAEGIRLSRVIDIMQSRAQVSIAIVDACRDNPLANTLMTRLQGQSRSLGLDRGLARLQSPLNDTLVAFATSPGTVAKDGASGNSPFTAALLNHIGTPGIEISTMLKRVSAEVIESTDGTQRPEVVSQMTQEFYFKGDLNITATITTENPQAREQSAASLLDAARVIPDPLTRRTALALVQTRYPDTGAAEMAGILITMIDGIEGNRDAANTTKRVEGRPWPVTEEKPAEAFGRFASLLDDTKPGVAENALSPEAREAALDLAGDDYFEVQRALNAIGFDVGTVDGQFGRRTRDAIKGFQVAYGIPSSGYLTAEVLNKLADTYNTAPRSYDGTYVVTVRRRWDDNWYKRNPDPFYVPGRKEPLATLTVKLEGGALLLVDGRHHTKFDGNWFEDFAGWISGEGDLSAKFTLNYNISKSKPFTLRMQTNLPERFPTGRTIEFEQGMFDPAFHINITIRRQ